MNFLIKISYSFPYEGAYGKRKRKQKLYYMALYFDIITFINGDHYAYN